MDSDQKAALVVNVPLACGAVFFAYVVVAGLLDCPAWHSPWDVACFALFVLTPVLSIAAVWYRR
jgi:hypothetical protein